MPRLKLAKNINEKIILYRNNALNNYPQKNIEYFIIT